jgi:hypothetical protein
VTTDLNCWFQLLIRQPWNFDVNVNAVQHGVGDQFLVFGHDHRSRHTVFLYVQIKLQRDGYAQSVKSSVYRIPLLIRSTKFVYVRHVQNCVAS